MLDEGIAGNRVLNDAACLGVSAQARLDRDVLSQPRLRAVILLEGVNEVGFARYRKTPARPPNTNVSAAQIIAGYQHIIARVHAAGAKIYGARMTPFEFSTAWTAAAEAKREAVNRWIRTAGEFDAVIDFAKVSPPLGTRGRSTRSTTAETTSTPTTPAITPSAEP